MNQILTSNIIPSLPIIYFGSFLGESNIFLKYYNGISENIEGVGGLVAQAVRHLPPTAGVPSSRLGPSMWVSWWMKRGLGRFFTGFLQFSPTTNFIPPFLHTHLIHFISSALVMVHQACLAGTLATHGPIIYGLQCISSLDPTLCWTRVEDIYIEGVQQFNTREESQSSIRLCSQDFKRNFTGRSMFSPSSSSRRIIEEEIGIQTMFQVHHNLDTYW